MSINQKKITKKRCTYKMKHQGSVCQSGTDRSCGCLGVCQAINFESQSGNRGIAGGSKVQMVERLSAGRNRLCLLTSYTYKLSLWIYARVQGRSVEVWKVSECALDLIWSITTTWHMLIRSQQ